VLLLLFFISLSTTVQSALINFTDHVTLSRFYLDSGQFTHREKDVLFLSWIEIIISVVKKSRQSDESGQVPVGNTTFWQKGLFVYLIVFNATFNNIYVVSWWSDLLVEETGGTGENHRPVANNWQTLSHNVVHIALIEIRTYSINSVVIGTDCIGSLKSNYYAITATTAPFWQKRVGLF